jgi:thymidylate kinase
MIIAFSGNDGSGKTTISSHVYEKLKSLGMTVEYRRGFEYFFLRFPLSLFGRRIESMREAFLTRDAKKPSYFKLWPFLVWFDCLVTWIYFELLRRGTVVLFDRYIYDFLVSWEYFGYSSKLIRYLYRCSPRPQLSFILDVPAEVAFNRSKYDHKFPLYFYQVQRERYLRLAAGALIIDTLKPIETTTNEIVSEILKCTHKRS